jgi:hypothetical protein
MKNFRSFQWCAACVNDTGDEHFLGCRVVAVAYFTGVNYIDERQKNTLEIREYSKNSN